METSENKLSDILKQAEEYTKEPPLSKKESIETLNTIVENAELLEFLRNTGIIQTLIANAASESEMDKQEVISFFKEKGV